MGSGLEPAGRGFLHAKVFVDVHDEVLRLGERVLLLEGVSDASEVIDRDGVERDRRLEVRMRRLEEVFLEARVGGEALALGMDTDDKEPGPVAASMIHGKAAAGLQMDYEDETEREKQVTMTHEIGTSSDISKFRLDDGDLEIEDLGKMAFQEYFLRAWTPKTSEEEALVHSPAHSPAATATYGSVLLHPIVRENTEGPAPSATTSGHPIDQPGLVSTFGGPAEAQRFFKRRYGGGYPASYSQDRNGTPRPIFPKRIIWSKNEAAVHAPNLPPSQASHSRQPTVTEEAEVEVIPVSRVSETTDVARNIEVACHRANMARLQPGRVELDRMSTLDPRAPLQHGGLGMGRGRRDSRPSSYNRRVKGTNQDPVADRWTQRFGPTLANERGNTDFGGSTGNLSSGDVFASGALQPRENEADSQSVAADQRRSMHRCSFMSGMNMKRNGSIDEGVGEAMNFFD